MLAPAHPLYPLWKYGLFQREFGKREARKIEIEEKIEILRKDTTLQLKVRLVAFSGACFLQLLQTRYLLHDTKDAMMHLSRPRMATLTATKTKIEVRRKEKSAAKDAKANLFNMFSSEGSTSSLHTSRNVLGNIAEPFEVTIPEAQQSRSSLHTSRLEDNKILSRTSGFEDALRVHFPFAIEDPKTLKFNLEPSSYIEDFNQFDQVKEPDEQLYETSMQMNQTIPYTQRVEDNFRRYLQITPDLIRQKAVEMNYEEQKSSIRGGRTKEKTRKILFDQETTVKKEYQHHRTILEESMLTLDRTRIGDQTKLTVSRIKHIREMQSSKESKRLEDYLKETLNEELGGIYDFVRTGKGNPTLDNFIQAHAHLEESLRRREALTTTSWGKEQARHEEGAASTPQFDRTNLLPLQQRDSEQNASQQKFDFLGGIDFSSDKKPAVQMDFLSQFADQDNHLMTIEETANDYTSKPVTDTRPEPQLSSYEIGQTQFNREKNLTSRVGEPIIEKEKQLDDFLQNAFKTTHKLSFKNLTANKPKSFKAIVFYNLLSLSSHDRVVLHQASRERFMDIYITKD